MAAGLMGLHRIPDHGVIAGVLAGIAEYFDWNVRLLRAAVVIVFIFSGFFPIVVLYELSIGIAGMAKRKRDAAKPSIMDVT